MYTAALQRYLMDFIDR